MRVLLVEDHEEMARSLHEDCVVRDWPSTLPRRGDWLVQGQHLRL